MITATRQLILTSDSAAEVMAAMARLDAAFVKAHKRKMAAGLFFSSWGERREGSVNARPVYGLTIYSEPGQETEARWIAENANANQP